MDLNLKQLQAFVWVADLGSFRRAAERLNTTQPNISARISALESLLGGRLMDRDAGSVRLTSQGQRLLTHARRVLAEVEALVEASGEAALYDTTLRLGVTEMIVHTWLREFLRVLKDRFPNLSVELTVDLSVNLERDLASRSLDLALQNGPFTVQMTGQMDLGTYPSVWVAGRTIARAGAPLADLADYPILTHARDTWLFRQIADHFAQRRDMPARLVPSSNLAACLQMTVDGMGIAALPAAMVSRELGSGDLVRLDYSWHPEPLQFFARYDAERAPRLVAQAARIATDVAKGFTETFVVPSLPA